MKTASRTFEQTVDSMAKEAFLLLLLVELVQLAFDFVPAADVDSEHTSKIVAAAAAAEASPLQTQTQTQPSFAPTQSLSCYSRHY